jgi:hypothetical protein
MERIYPQDSPSIDPAAAGRQAAMLRLWRRLLAPEPPPRPRSPRDDV